MGVPRFAAAIAVILILVADSVLGVPPPKHRWRRARTKHFTIISNDHPHDIEQVASEFERFHTFMTLHENQNDAQDPTLVFLFRDEDTFAPYKKNPDGKVSNFVGIFVDTQYDKYIAMTSGRSGDPLRTVYHEYTHYFQSRKSVSLPLWFAEGMAEYFSTFRGSGDKFHIGQIVDAHVELLRVKPLLALGDLFAMTADSPDYNEGERQGIFYAQSWALYHYMRHERHDLFEKLTPLLEALNSGSSTKEAFQAVYGIDSRSVQNGLEKYVRQARFGYRDYKVDLDVSEAFDVQDIPRPELLGALGTYLADATPSETEAAEEHLLESLALEPAQPRLFAVLGQVYARQGRHTEATQQFERAISLAPDDALTYARYGNHLVRSYMEENDRIPSAPEALSPSLMEARQLLMRAVDLDPANGEAFASLGKTYLFDPEDIATGLQTLNVARSFLPGSMDLVYYQVLLLLRLGERATARGLTDQVLAHARDRQLHKLAEEALQNAATGRVVDLYNEAVDQFNMQRFARALEILEDVLPAIDDPSWREAAEKLVVEARGPVGAGGHRPHQ